MRGLSIIIVMVLLTIIVISLVGLMYVFSSKIFTTTTSTTQESLNETTKNILAGVMIRTVSDDKIMVRNTGQTELTNFSIFIGGNSISFEIEKPILSPGEITTIYINKIEVSPGVWNYPTGDIEVSTGEGASSTYRDYQGYAGSVILYLERQQYFSPFTSPVNGYTVKARADGQAISCYIYYTRENDRVWDGYMWSGYNYKDSSYPDMIYDPSSGNCITNITTLDIGQVYWSNLTASGSYTHPLVIDNDYIYLGDIGLVVYKMFLSNGSLQILRDLGIGNTRGMSSDSEFLYFGDSLFVLRKVNKTDLTLNSSQDYGTAIIYSTAVDDTGVYWGNGLYNITKVNKTNFAQILWSVDYGSASVYDMEVDANYLYVVDSVGNITKIDKTNGNGVWSLRPTTAAKYAIALDGNNLWIGDANSTLWQINTDGSITNYTYYKDTFYGGSNVILYEVTYDNDFIYFTDAWADLNRVNKTSKEIEYVYSYSGNTYGLACETDYCYYYGGKNIIKIRKIPLYDIYGNLNPGFNYTSSERIKSYIGFYDIDYNLISTGEATYSIP